MAEAGGFGGFFGGRGKKAPKHRTPNKREEKRRKGGAPLPPTEPEIIDLGGLAASSRGEDAGTILPFPGKGAIPDGPVPDALSGADAFAGEEAPRRALPPPDPDTFAWEDDADALPAETSLAIRRRDMRPADPEDDFGEEYAQGEALEAEAEPDDEPETLRGYSASREAAPAGKLRGVNRALAGVAACLLAACAVGMALYAFVARIVVMEEGAMGEAVRHGEYVTVLLCDYWLKEPERGDVVLCAFAGFDGYALRRVVGMPGEMLLIRGGTVYVDGRPLVERYAADCEDFGPVMVAEGGYFVLSDERADAADSRMEAVGSVPRASIRGKAAMVVYPFENLRVLRD